MPNTSTKSNWQQCGYSRLDPCIMHTFYAVATVVCNCNTPVLSTTLCCVYSCPYESMHFYTAGAEADFDACSNLWPADAPCGLCGLLNFLEQTHTSAGGSVGSGGVGWRRVCTPGGRWLSPPLATAKFLARSVTQCCAMSHYI